MSSRMLTNNAAAGASASVPSTARDIVLSLGRIVADGVRIDATEAHAVLQQVWHRIRATRDTDGGVIGCPPLDAMGITPFGDFKLRRAVTTGARSVRPAHALTRELGELWLRLLASGDAGLADVPAAGIEMAARTTGTGPSPPALDRVVTPGALFRAIDEFRPSDASDALAGLYGRWLRTTDAGQLRPGVLPAAPAPSQRDEPLAHLPLQPIVAASRTGSSAPSRPIAAVLLAVVCIVLSGLIGWQWMRQEPRAVPAERADASPSVHLPSSVPQAPTGPSREDAAPTAMAPPPPADAAPARVRRVLDASRTGRAPYSPSFDPRTRALVFHAGRDQSALLQASLRSDGSVDEVSTVREDGSRNYHAQVSPDGEHLAYDSDADGTRGVYVANRDGSSPRRVSGPGHGSVPTWSPDGQTLAFARAEVGRPRVWNIWTVHVPTGTLRRITAHRVGQPWGASWFPDGERMAYSLEDRLMVHDLASGAARTYPTPVRGRMLRTPAVSPDGERIVFQVHRDGAWVLDLRTGQPDRLLADPSAQEFAWSPDGRQVAYHSVRGGGWGIWLMEMTEAP